MEKNIYLSVVMSAYNEAERIKDTVIDVAKYLARQNYSYEIVVVNDGSKDETAKRAREALAIVPSMVFIDNEKNQGKGGGVRQGMLAAKGQYRIYVDADNAISIEQIESFWPYIKDSYDLVIGSIELPGSVKKDKYEGFRKVLGKFSKYLVRIVAIWEIHDTQRAFKLFKGEVVEKIFPRLTITRWGFDIEILVIAKHLGYKIKELPVTWINPPGGRVTLMGYFNTLKELMQIKFNLWRGKYD